ncbi:MAG: hypothetical protein ACM34N_05135 [Ignavibacteria bacterium]
MPGKTYVYQTRSMIKGKEEIGDTLQVKTLDTTSHDFTWQKYEFGEGASSIFNDVAIIDENNIYAVGEIYLNDSTGQLDINAYNLVKRDGNSWNFQRIMFYTICGQQNRTPYPAKSIFIFNENSILVAMNGDQIAKIENGTQTTTFCLPWSFTINKFWGINDNDFYMVGNGGNIVHYQNGTWQKIESGTELNLNDI